MYKFDLDDTCKLSEAKQLIQMVYEYNYTQDKSLDNKLETIIKKLEKVIEEYGVE